MQCNFHAIIALLHWLSSDQFKFVAVAASAAVADAAVADAVAAAAYLKENNGSQLVLCFTIYLGIYHQMC